MKSNSNETYDVAIFRLPRHLKEGLRHVAAVNERTMSGEARVALETHVVRQQLQTTNQEGRD